jgi:hypothetical protein
LLCVLDDLRVTLFCLLLVLLHLLLGCFVFLFGLLFGVECVLLVHLVLQLGLLFVVLFGLLFVLLLLFLGFLFIVSLLIGVVGRSIVAVRSGRADCSAESGYRERNPMSVTSVKRWRSRFHRA